MKHTKILVLITIALLLATAASASSTVLSKANELRIDFLRADPSPIEPGKQSDLWFEITNLKSQDINNFGVRLVDGSPRLLDTQTTTLNFGKLKSGDKIQFKFTILPNADIIDGTYNLFLQYFSDEIDQITSQKITVNVKRVNRDVTVTSIKVNPASGTDTGMLMPGEPSELTLSFQNTAEYTMRDITLTLDMESSSLPIAPLGTTTEAKIASLSPGQSKDITFNIIALPDATANVYKIPLRTKYYDALGNNFTKNDLVGVIVDGEPEIHVEIKDSSIYSSFGTGEITINFVNKGLSKIKFLTVQINESEDKGLLGKDYEILSEDKLYLGDVEPDDDTGADFTIKTRTLSKSITLPVTIDFRDANNKRRTQTFQVNMDIHSKTELGLEKSSYTWKITLLAAVLIFLYKYRKWKKTHRDNKGLINYVRSLLSKLIKK